jgi:hypothetical protein
MGYLLVAGYGVLTVTLSIETGLRAALSGAPLFGNAAIASTASMPEVTRPKIE